MKKCSKCKFEKDLSCFVTDRAQKSGLSCQCKPCKNEVRNRRRHSNREDYNKKQREYLKQWRASGKEKEYRNKRYASDIDHRLGKLARNRLYRLMLDIPCTLSPEDLLGCSIADFRLHLESNFEPWMNWENYGRFDETKDTWQVDHVIPISSFKLSDEAELKKAFHWSNCIPLSAVENLRKGCR